MVYKHNNKIPLPNDAIKFVLNYSPSKKLFMCYFSTRQRDRTYWPRYMYAERENIVFGGILGNDKEVI